MPKQRTYGTPIGIPGGGSEAPSSSKDRQTAQPPSESYIRAELNRKQRLTTDSPPPAKRPKPTEASGPSPSDSDNPTRDLSAATAARRIAGRKRQIDKAVDDAT